MTAAVLPISSEAGLSPVVSVIVPMYNGAEDLPGLLQALAQQTYAAAAVEYLIVDNGSSDQTADLLQAASQQFATQGLTLRPLAEAQIQSSYAARNAGIRAARGDILVFTDADCRPTPTWLEHLIEPLRSPLVGLVAGEIKALPGTTWLEQHAERQETLSQKHTLAHPFRPYGQTANLAVRRSVFAAVGLFRPYLTTGGDADFCWRSLALETWTLQFQPTAIVQHRHRSTLPELLSQWRRYGQSNRYLHDLHGVPLMTPLSIAAQGRSWARWVGKELPLGTLRAIANQDSLVDVLNTPIGWLCNRARWQGQQAAVLPEQARYIEPF